MNISAPFIARPVATWLLSIAILLAGVLGYRALPVSALPQVDFPTIQITTRLPGANPETVASLITAPLERQFGQIPGLISLSSDSAEATSRITLQFELNRPIDAAAQDVQAAINAAAGSLPNNLPYPPTYNKVNPADAPVLSLALTSETILLSQIADVADTVLQPKLAQIDGVGKVTVQGGLRAAVRVQADPARLAAYGLSMADLRTAIAAANVNGAKGGFDGPRLAFSVGANDQLLTPEAYKELVIAWRGRAPVRLSDIGSVVAGVENERSGAWLYRPGADGVAVAVPAAVLDIQRQPGANIVRTVERIRAALPALQRGLPTGIELEIVSDRTETIRASVRDVQITLGIAIGLVVAVIYVFLHSLRATFIPAIALPLSLLGTFGVMALLGYSLDNLSLMALTVATGFVVDDAIVMIENVARHVEEGEHPLAAAYRGARQIGFTIVSLTVSLIGVFIPLLFMSGVVGRLFQEFAVTLSVAVIVSAVVSLTLTPMLCARMLRPNRKAITREGWVLALYRRSLGWSLRHQGAVLLVSLGTLVGTVWLYVAAPKGFLPSQDTGLIAVVTEAGEGVSIPALAAMQDQAAVALRADKAVAAVTSFVGVGGINATPNAGRITVVLRPLAERDPMGVVLARMTAAGEAVPGLKLFFQPVQDIQIGARISRTQFQYTLMDTDAETLAEWVPRLEAALRAAPALRHVTADRQEGGPRSLVRVDRDAAARLGVSMQAVQDALYDSFGQRPVSTIFGQANQYRVVLEAEPDWRADPSVLTRMRVPATGGAQVPLAAIASIERTSAPLLISRLAQFPAATISFDVAEGHALSDAVTAVATAERAIGMPATIQGSYAGEALEFSRALAGQPWLILASLVVIYIVLGMLYESWLHPITILSTLPSAGIGAVLALLFCGLDLSLVALVGIVLLMGIVKKNAIMMVDFAIEAVRVRGLSHRAAIEEACLLRFRPIMMTTAAALLGALPLVLDRGTGSELRYPLGVTIVGGLLLSQFLTLYTTPAIYLGLEQARAWVLGARPVPAAGAAE